MQQGSARDDLLQDLLREVTFLCAVNEIELGVVHIFGKNNRIPDSLSCYHLHPKYVQQFDDLCQQDWRQVVVLHEYFDISSDW